MEASSARADGIPSPSAVPSVVGLEMPSDMIVGQINERIPKKKPKRQTERQGSVTNDACTGECSIEIQMREAAVRKESVKRKCLNRRMRQRTSFFRRNHWPGAIL